MRVDGDREHNDVPLVPGLVDRVRGLVASPSQVYRQIQQQIRSAKFIRWYR